MRLDLLSKKQVQLIPILKKCTGFYLAGGTALALQIGHRKSIDFDLFSPESIKYQRIKEYLSGYPIEQTLVNTPEELTVIVNSVKLTFVEYPFKIPTCASIDLGIAVVEPLTIAAMKAYTIGRRAKWKDYVDMYFLIREYGLDTICKEAEGIFGTLFGRKNLYEQLCYFEDIDDTEQAEFIGIQVAPADIKKYLCDQATMV